MKIQLLKPDLHQIDRVAADTFVAYVFEDERPPRGMAGLLDWRLCGTLSNLMLSGQVTGRLHEAVLLPSYGRAPTRRVCIYGLGPVGEFTAARARECSQHAAQSLFRMRAESFIGSLPGSPLTTLPARTRMEAFLEEVLRAFGGDTDGHDTAMFIVEPQGVHRDLTEVAAAIQKKIRATWR